MQIFVKIASKKQPLWTQMAELPYSMQRIQLSFNWNTTEVVILAHTNQVARELNKYQLTSLNTFDLVLCFLTLLHFIIFRFRHQTPSVYRHRMR